MKTSSWRGISALLAGLLIAVGLSTHADIFYVSVSGAGFSPSSQPIHVGDTVVWENVDGSDFPHTTTSTLGVLDPNYWNSYLVNLGDTFSHTFNNPGTFYYIDQVDIGTGNITVSPAVAAPVINLVSPHLAGGQFLFDATGLTIGKTNVLLSSTNLTTWLPSSTNTTTSDPITFTNAGNLGRRFYRVVELP